MRAEVAGSRHLHSAYGDEDIPLAQCAERRGGYLCLASLIVGNGKVPNGHRPIILLPSQFCQNLYGAEVRGGPLLVFKADPNGPLSQPRPVFHTPLHCISNATRA